MIYWRLSSFYLFYFAALGALVPYWGLYLKSIGFDAKQIGTLLAIIMATKIIAPNVWGWIADHTGRRMRIVRLASLIAVIAFSGVFFGNALWWLVVVMTVFSFFWNASLPQFEATTMNHLGKGVHRYSTIRLWGSVGFILAVAILGFVFDHISTEILPAVICILLVGIWISSLFVPERAAGHLHLSGEPISRVLKSPPVIALLTVCFLMQASHGPYYAFFSIYLDGHGYARGLIGQLWALGVIAEIGVFLVMHRLLPRYGAKKLLLVSLCLGVARWLMIAWFVDHIEIIVVAQCLHAASFGVYHAVAISLIHEYFTGSHQGRGQAIYSSLSFGAGGALGSMVSGLLWDSMGAELTYTLAASFSALALLIAWRRLA